MRQRMRRRRLLCKLLNLVIFFIKELIELQALFILRKIDTQYYYKKYICQIIKRSRSCEPKESFELD